MAFNQFAGVLAIGLMACGSGPKQVVVAGTPRDLRFSVIAPKGASEPCAKNLSVTPVVPEDAYPAWQVASAGIDSCFDTLRYGELAADLAQRVPATPLRPNVEYRVRVSGGGFSVFRNFRLTPQGVTMQE